MITSKLHIRSRSLVFVLAAGLFMMLLPQEKRAVSGVADPGVTVVEPLIAKSTHGLITEKGSTYKGENGRVFIIQKGRGAYLVRGFNAAERDFLRFQGFGLTDPDALLARASQEGPDTVIALPDGSKARIENTRVNDIPKGSLQLELDRTRLTQTFAEEFDTFSWYAEGLAPEKDRQGIWRTNYGWGPPTAEHSRSLPNEQQVYVDPAFKGTGTKPFGLNPFQVSNGTLEIRAEKAPEAMLPYIWGRKYTSGLITSKYSFAQLYGVFEIRAKLPKGKGFFPAFWLLPADSTWPPELDVFELLGHDLKTVYTTVHSKASGEHTNRTFTVDAPDLTADFHQFAVSWQKDEIRWYLDGVEVARMPTPADMHKPMYVLANLSVGAPWPGEPDSTTRFPGVLAIDWIRVYKSAEPVANSATLAH